MIVFVIGCVVLYIYSANNTARQTQNMKPCGKEQLMKKGIKRVISVICATALVCGISVVPHITAHAGEDDLYTDEMYDEYGNMNDEHRYEKNTWIGLSQSLPQELQSGSLDAIVDQVAIPRPHFGSGPNMKIWTNYKAAQQGIRTAEITFDYGEFGESGRIYSASNDEVIADTITIHYYVDNHSTDFPESLSIRVQQVEGGEIYPCTVTGGEYISDMGNYIYSVNYNFGAPMPINKLFLELTAKNGKKPGSGAAYSIGISEVSLYCSQQRYIVSENSGYGAVAGTEDTVHGGNLSNAFDNDPSTIWHSDWKGATGQEERYVTIQLVPDYFLNEYTAPNSYWERPSVSRLSYLPRQSDGSDGSDNGRIADYRISTSRDGVNWTEVATGRFENNGDRKVVDFPAQYATFVRLEGLTTYGSRQNTHISAAEIRVLSGF